MSDSRLVVVDEIMELLDRQDAMLDVDDVERSESPSDDDEMPQLEMELGTLIGVVCHLSLYNFDYMEKKPVLVCHFLETGYREPLTKIWHTFLVSGSAVNISELSEWSASYLSIATTYQVRTVRERLLDERTKILTRVLLDDNELIRVLSKQFSTVELTLDESGIEILRARSILLSMDVFGILGTLDVGRLRPTATYSNGGSIKSDNSIGDSDFFGETTSLLIGASVRENLRSRRKRTYLDRSETSKTISEKNTISNRDLLKSHQTQAYYKLSNSYIVRELVFSLRFCDQCCLFERMTAEYVPNSLETLQRAFTIRDFTWKGRQYRILAPRGFLALVFSNDHCLLAMRTAIRELFHLTYMDWHGEKPMFDYLGPDFFSQGNARSVFFPGFPFLAVYGIPGNHNLSDETALDAIDEIRSQCGLPDIIGPRGKFQIPLKMRKPPRVEEPELEVFFSDEQKYRFNGRVFCHEVHNRYTTPASSTSVNQTATSDSGDAGTIDKGSLDHKEETENGELIHLYVNECEIVRVSIPTLETVLLQMCICVSEFPLTGLGTRRNLSELTTRFVEQLRHQSGALFLYLKCLKSYIAHHVTTACASNEITWIMVERDQSFYLRCDPPSTARHVETYVCEAFGNCWERLYGSRVNIPICVVDIQPYGLLIINGEDEFLRAFVSENGGEEPAGESMPLGRGKSRIHLPIKHRHWTHAASRFITELVGLTFADLGLLTQNELYVRLRGLVLEFAAKRHDRDYWSQSFQPGRHAVEPHDGILDCGPFSGVWTKNDNVMIQTWDCALSDDVDYERYIRRTVAYIHLTFKQIAVSLSQSVPPYLQEDKYKTIFEHLQRILNTVEKDIIRDYKAFFKIC